MGKKLQKRSTYIGQKDRTQSGEVTQLRFVISNFKFDDDTGKECALVVNMTSKKGTRLDDLTCELDVGDHEDIIHASYIEYARAERVPKSYILENVAKGHFVLRETISEELLRKIQDGVFKRIDDMPKFVENYIDEF